MAPSRRDALHLAGTALAMMGLRRLARASDHPPTPAAGTHGPRYWVFVLASGGWDAVLTLDPKTRRQVEPGLDVPYDANQLIAGPGVPLGPTFAPLRRWATKLAVVNNVQVSSANHEYCWMQWTRMRRGVHASMPMIFHLLGQHRDGQPLASVAVGPGSMYDYGTGYFGSRASYYGDPVKFEYTGYSADDRRFLDELDHMSPDELAVMARALRKQERYLRGLGGERNAQAATAAGEAAALFEAMPRYSKFQVEDWGPQQSTQSYRKLAADYVTADGSDDLSRDFQRGLWALRNDIAKVVYIRAGTLEWDTHQNNLERQTTWNTRLAAALDKFIERLETTRNEHGTLASQTTLVVGSECGRYPRVNPHLGKDHLPEVPHLFYGANINAGSVFGGTDRQMLGLPVDLCSGRPTKGGTQITLDDVGTTLLAMNGMTPDIYGYAGRTLRFLGT